MNNICSLNTSIRTLERTCWAYPKFQGAFFGGPGSTSLASILRSLMLRQEGLSRIWRNGWMRLQNMFKEANLSMRCSAEFLMDSHGESHLKNTSYKMDCCYYMTFLGTNLMS